GDSASFAVDADGVAWSWGRNLWGQLGDGTTDDRHAIAAMTLPAGVTISQIVSRGYVGVAVGSDDLVYGWGSNHYGKLDGGDVGLQRPAPAPMIAPPAGTIYSQIAVGGAHMLAILSDGTTLAWGINDVGAL